MKLDLSKSVYELCKHYPELINIMVDMGFVDIQKKHVLNTMGRIMTIPKGAIVKGIPMSTVIAKLISAGFEIEGNKPFFETTITDRSSQIKKYLERLNAGEALDSVKADFVKEFSHVDPSEIMQAEQKLLKEGVELKDVQKLCDVHSALFHGTTCEEQNKANFADDKEADFSELKSIKGHPLRTLSLENANLKKLLEEIRPIISKKGDVDNLLCKIRQVSTHYAKKGDLLYPLLKLKYNFNGPSDVMWTVDDEIRDEFSKLQKDSTKDDAWYARLQKNIDRADEMIYKEENILFPLCAQVITKSDWQQIYNDSKDYDLCFDVEKETFDEVQNQVSPKVYDGEIHMPGGHMKLDELIALLNTIPLEISFIDADNINRFFNEGPKVFKRPSMALDRDVFSCHPPKIEPMVRSIIDSFRNGTRDNVDVWMEKAGKTMYVNYMAVRDSKGKYLGTVELVQDMEFAKKHFNK